MKITRAEFDEFSNSLSDDWYFEGADDISDGSTDPSDVFEIPKDAITICYQGKDHIPESQQFKDFVIEFQKWKKGIGFEFITLKIPKGKSNEIKNIVKEYLQRKTHDS